MWVSPGMVGGGRTSTHRPGTPGSHTTPVYWASSRSWVHPVLSITTGQRCSTAGCCAQGHQAQDGNIPWVGASQHPRDSKSVLVHRLFCAKLLRSSRCNRMNDRVDEGCIPVYSLRYGNVAQRGGYSSGRFDAGCGCA